MALRKVDQKYLESLAHRQASLDAQIHQRQQKQKDVNRMFMQHVKRELDLLNSEKDKMAQRNEIYLNQVKNYTKEFNKVLPELMEAEEKLNRAKLQYQRALEKHLK